VNKKYSLKKKSEYPFQKFIYGTTKDHSSLNVSYNTDKNIKNILPNLQQKQFYVRFKNLYLNRNKIYVII